MAEAEDPSSLRAMLPGLREIVETAAAELREGRVPLEELAVARRLSQDPERYVARTAAAEVTRELCGRGVPLRPGSKIRYLLTDEGKDSCGTKPRNAGGVPPEDAPRARGAERQHGRAMGFLDGSEAPDLEKYEEMLRAAAEEVLVFL